MTKEIVVWSLIVGAPLYDVLIIVMFPVIRRSFWGPEIGNQVVRMASVACFGLAVIEHFFLASYLIGWDPGYRWAVLAIGLALLPAWSIVWYLRWRYFPRKDEG